MPRITQASDNDIEVPSDTISSIKILDENENPQKNDDIIVFFRKIFFVIYEKFKKRDIQEKTRNLRKPR